MVDSVGPPLACPDRVTETADPPCGLLSVSRIAVPAGKVLALVKTAGEVAMLEGLHTTPEAVGTALGPPPPGLQATVNVTPVSVTPSGVVIVV